MVSEPIRYESMSIEYPLPNGKIVRAGFSDLEINLLMATGTPFITQEFEEAQPEGVQRFVAERKYHLGSSSSDCFVHNPAAYSFMRITSMLRGVPISQIDGMIEQLQAALESKVMSREALLQFYAVVNVPPPPGFDEMHRS